MGQNKQVGSTGLQGPSPLLVILLAPLPVKTFLVFQMELKIVSAFHRIQRNFRGNFSLICGAIPNGLGNVFWKFLGYSWGIFL